MRFRLGVEVCVEVDSLDTLDELDGRAADAMTQAVNEWLIKDPEHGSISGVSIEGLDDESTSAIEDQAAEWEDGVGPIERIKRSGPRPVDG